MEKRYDKYINYSVADFVLDDDFIDWVKCPTEQQDKFWNGLVAENTELEKNFRDAIILINSIDSNIPKNDLAIKERVWEAIVDGYNTRKIIPIRRNKFWMIAASVLAILMFGTYLMLNKIPAPGEDQPLVKNQPLKNDVAPGGNKATLQLADGSTIILDSSNNGNIANQGQTKIIKIDGQLAYNADGSSKEILYNTISTPRGGQYQLILADGSKVWLNAASSLHFPTSFIGKERKVTLTGEGYFEVAKNADMPFKVEIAGKGEVEVLGTHFNVNAYEDEATVKTTLLEGAIKVYKGTSQQLLNPGEQAVFNSALNADKITLNRNVDVAQVVAWKNGYFQFDNVNIQNIMRQMTRWYDVEVVYSGNVPVGHYVGKPSRNLNLSQILKIIEYSGIKLKLENKVITVSE